MPCVQFLDPSVSFLIEAASQSSDQVMERLANGDLGPYHLLYNPETRLLNGIIDFGTAGIGDPACDFACIINQYGESFLQRMMVYYPEIEPALDRARFWAGTLELQWLLGGLRSGDNSWFGVHLGRGMDRLPYGANA